MNEQHFIVASPSDFKPVIEFVLEIVSNEPALSQFTTPTTPTPPSVNHERAGSFMVTLEGDLGAGKTTFVQELAKQLGIAEPVTSPTFGIMKAYEAAEGAAVASLVHIDAYRIEDIAEAGPLRFEELWQQPRTLVCIEWPERIQDILPKKRIEISIEIIEEEKREVVVRF